MILLLPVVFCIILPRSVRNRSAILESLYFSGGYRGSGMTRGSASGGCYLQRPVFDPRYVKFVIQYDLQNTDGYLFIYMYMTKI